MKTFKLITPVLLIAVMVLAAGCGDENPVAPQVQQEAHKITWDAEVNSQVVGVWLFVSASVNGQAADLGETLELQPGAVGAAFGIAPEGDYVYLEFDANYDQVLMVEGTVATGTCNKGEQHLKISAPDASYSGTWSRGGDTLALKASADGQSTVLKAEFIDAGGSPDAPAILGR